MSKNKSKGQHEYQVLHKRSYGKGTIEDVFDILYSKFGFDVISRLLLGFTENQFRKEQKQKVTGRIAQNLSAKVLHQLDADVNMYYLQKELGIWALMQTSNLENENNIYLPKKVEDIKDLEIIIGHFFKQRARIFGYRPNQINITPKIKTVMKKLQPKQIFPQMYKNHTPPLLKSKASLEYEIVTLKGDYIPDYKIYFTDVSLQVKKEKTSTIADFLPLEEVAIGYNVKGFSDAVFMHLRRQITQPSLDHLKRRFEPTRGVTDKDFLSIVFKLLEYYQGLGLGSFLYEDLHIVDKKIIDLQQTSIELLATPFTNARRPYFGLYPDVEQHFGSMGSYFDVKPKAGMFSLRMLPSYLLVKDAIERVDMWLKDAKKAKRDLTIMFWYPKFKAMYYGDIEPQFRNEQGNPLEEDQTILRFAEEDLEPKLAKSPFKKEVIGYFPGKKISPTTNDYKHRIYILSV